MTLNPFYFGESERQLFGMYDPARGGGRRGAVVCHPWGQEYLRAHQSVRHLARLLARKRVHAMRFDYHGSGDSAGGDTDGSVRQWRDDVGTAVEELRDIAGLRSVGLIGVRFGAPLAVACAADRRDVDRLVLWDPVCDGAAYVHEITGNGAEQGAVEARGFLLTESLRAEMIAISTEDFRHALPSTLIVSTTEADAHAALERTLRGAGVDVTTAHCPGPQVWEEEADFAAAGMPVAALEEIARWMSE